MRCPSCVPANRCRCGFRERAGGVVSVAQRLADERAALEASVAHLRPSGKAARIQLGMAETRRHRERGERQQAILRLVTRTWRSAQDIFALLPVGFTLSGVRRRLCDLSTRRVIESRAVRQPRTPGRPLMVYRRTNGGCAS